ncbi:enoyl-CoA hydratase-related protein [Mycobacterium arosiense]|uniref:enoyl-CoA hydratase-related protein n=1 Tax=Mycobacterium arosiense TaxID=425468 RepID=UPI0011543301|nr:enoyl-CoA hydratase-related protein [Mycobacterium arosiense]
MRPLHRSAGDLLVETQGGVASVIMNRPDRLNAMTPELQKNLLATLAELDRSEHVRAIVLTGAGGGFCSGADRDVLDRVHELVGTDELQAQPPILHTPLIAAVNGPAIGIGFSIMLLADVIYVARDAKIASSFSRLGLVAEWGAAWTLQRRVGYGAAADILLSGRSVAPAEALRLGLAQRVLPADELLPAAKAWAADIATNTSPYSAANIKRQLGAAATQSFGDAFELSLALEEAALMRPDLAEAIRARAERRSPKFPPHRRC